MITLKEISSIPVDVLVQKLIMEDGKQIGGVSIVYNHKTGDAFICGLHAERKQGNFLNRLLICLGLKEEKKVNFIPLYKQVLKEFNFIKTWWGFRKKDGVYTKRINPYYVHS